MWKILDMFHADREKRGQYVPPIMIQMIEPDNDTVLKTLEFMGSGFVMATQGGETGVVPGAPKEFNEKQRSAWKDKDLGESAWLATTVYAPVDTGNCGTNELEATSADDSSVADAAQEELGTKNSPSHLLVKV